MNKIEQGAENKILEDKIWARWGQTYYTLAEGLAATSFVSMTRPQIIEAMQEFGNQRFNAALSEAIACFNPVFDIEPKKENLEAIVRQLKHAFENLEGLKIKP